MKDEYPEELGPVLLSAATVSRRIYPNTDNLLLSVR